MSTAGRCLKARTRLLVLSAGRRVYRLLNRGSSGPNVANTLLQSTRRKFRPRMGLRDVEEVLDALDGEELRWWLAGGWGVDALLGRPMRPHRDVDVVVDRADLASALTALERRGFRPYEGVATHVPGSLLPDRVVAQDGAGRTVDLHPLDLAAWLIPLPPGKRFAVGSLNHRQVRCLSRDAQRALHQGFALADRHVENLRLLDEPAL